MSISAEFKSGQCAFWLVSVNRGIRGIGETVNPVFVEEETEIIAITVYTFYYCV